MTNFKISFIALALFGSTLLFSQEIKSGPHSLESHGYVRTGLGRSLSGGEMVQFQAPGALVKPRFGNEANHYTELQFNYKYQPEGRTDSYEIVYMIANYLPYTNQSLVEAIRPETTQLYFKWNDLYKGADIWAGRRYYQRENIDILDWFWLNSAQKADVGFGVEDLNLGNSSNLAIAFMRFTSKLNDPINPAFLAENYKLDVRVKEIPLAANLNLNILGQLGIRPEVEDYDYDNKTGYTVGAWTKYANNNFSNRTSAIYRKGINMVENPYSGLSLLEYTPEGSQQYDLDESSDLQITTDFYYDDKTSNGFLGAVTYQYKDFGIQTVDGDDKTFSHINATGRYSRYISKHLALTVESGYDHIIREGEADGNLFKISIAPEIKWDKGMFSRPTIRPFVTYAKWSDELKGEVGVFNGNDVYADQTSGLTAGLQLEIWW